MPQGLVEWIKVETKLANPALAKAAETTGHPDLKQAIAWSKEVNEAVEKIVREVPPFPFRPRKPGKADGQGRPAGRFRHAHRGAQARMGRA